MFLTKRVNSQMCDFIHPKEALFNQVCKDVQVYESLLPLQLLRFHHLHQYKSKPSTTYVSLKRKLRKQESKSDYGTSLVDSHSTSFFKKLPSSRIICKGKSPNPSATASIILLVAVLNSSKSNTPFESRSNCENRKQ